MQFTNHFQLPLAPREAWPLLLDVQSMVPCMPGAELVEVVDDRTFKGKVSVRLGPVALTFNCTATFESVDNEQHVARIKAQGADAKGRGNASATIDFRLEPAGSGTRAAVTTDLSLSGAVAQYGRGAGMIQSVANQIILQFAKNLEARIEQGRQAQPGAAVSAADAGASAQEPAAAAAASVHGPAVKPIGGLSLIFGVLWQALTGWFRGTAK
jgi:uncharacterized protein